MQTFIDADTAEKKEELNLQGLITDVYTHEGNSCDALGADIPLESDGSPTAELQAIGIPFNFDESCLSL